MDVHRQTDRHTEVQAKFPTTCYSRTEISCRTVNLQTSPWNSSVKYTHTHTHTLFCLYCSSLTVFQNHLWDTWWHCGRGFESRWCRSSRTMALGLTQPLTNIVVSRWIRRRMQGSWFSAAVLVYWRSSWSEVNGPNSDTILPAAGTAATLRKWFFFGLLKYPLYDSRCENRSHTDGNFLYFAHSSCDETEQRHSQVVGRPRF